MSYWTKFTTLGLPPSLWWKQVSLVFDWVFLSRFNEPNATTQIGKEIWNDHTCSRILSHLHGLNLLVVASLQTKNAMSKIHLSHFPHGCTQSHSSFISLNVIFAPCNASAPGYHAHQPIVKFLLVNQHSSESYDTQLQPSWSNLSSVVHNMKLAWWKIYPSAIWTMHSIESSFPICYIYAL